MPAPSPRTSSAPRVVIVGGGLAGLSAAVELARRGATVTIVERNRHLGGKMNVLAERGFSFDMGPTILTMPQVLRGIFARCGRDIAEYVELIRLDPQWRCFYEDGTVIDLREGVDPMADALERQFPGSGVGAGWRAFLAYSRRMFRLSEKVFFYRDLGGIGDLMLKPPREPGVLPDVLAMRMHSTVAATVHGMIREPHVRQLAEHFLQYVGSSPFLAPAILSLIAAAQADHGCWYAAGGTRMVAAGLARLAEELGVTPLLGEGVRRIVGENGRVVAVELENGMRLPADAVVSNCDVQRTLRDLVGGEGADPSTASAARRAGRSIASAWSPACSGVVLYLGLDRQYEHLAHHCFLFSRDSVEEFDDIYRKGIPARDPTIYLAVPSRSDPSQAPPGCEALYALIHTPHLRPGQRWEGPGGLLEQYRPTILAKLARLGLVDIERHIVLERSLTPASIERLYNAEGGAIYGLASHGRFRGGFKPRNRSSVLRGLYLAGGSANPGPGVPMVLMSGVTAADALAEDFGVTEPPPSAQDRPALAASAS
ncbi:MAG TPA: phytoene desaturase family protein [Phycisphaerales bacterium]|nr:phytoene desaturase family protein [Phycisphaerales bacterium]HMP38619.1 phytoene desaturase family protein [Phycisphaerales bacterium]